MIVIKTKLTILEYYLSFQFLLVEVELKIQSKLGKNTSCGTTLLQTSLPCKFTLTLCHTLWQSCLDTLTDYTTDLSIKLRIKINNYVVVVIVI